MLLKIRSKEALSLTTLNREILRFIYDRDSMSTADIDVMFDSCKTWVEHFRLEKMKREDLIPGLVARNMIGSVAELVQPHDEERFAMMMAYLNASEDTDPQSTNRLSQLIQQNKKSFKEHNIDYKKYFRFPEMYVGTEAIKRRVDALAAVEKSNQENS